MVCDIYTYLGILHLLIIIVTSFWGYLKIFILLHSLLVPLVILLCWLLRLLRCVQWLYSVWTLSYQLVQVLGRDLVDGNKVVLSVIHAMEAEWFALHEWVLRGECLCWESRCLGQIDLATIVDLPFHLFYVPRLFNYWALHVFVAAAPTWRIRLVDLLKVTRQGICIRATLASHIYK